MSQPPTFLAARRGCSRVLLDLLQLLVHLFARADACAKALASSTASPPLLGSSTASPPPLGSSVAALLEDNNAAWRCGTNATATCAPSKKSAAIHRVHMVRVTSRARAREGMLESSWEQCGGARGLKTNRRMRCWSRRARACRSGSAPRSATIRPASRNCSSTAALAALRRRSFARRRAPTRRAAPEAARGALRPLCAGGPAPPAPVAAPVSASRFSELVRGHSARAREPTRARGPGPRGPEPVRSAARRRGGGGLDGGSRRPAEPRRLVGLPPRSRRRRPRPRARARSEPAALVARALARPPRRRARRARRGARGRDARARREGARVRASAAPATPRAA